MSLIDTHAHLAGETLSGDLEGVLQRALARGVGRILAVAVDRTSSEESVALAQRHPQQIWASVGVQPNYVAEIAAGDRERIAALATDDCVVAIGETGLDRYWKDVPFDLQQSAFTWHLELACQCQLPVIIHMRDCGDDVVAAVRPFAGPSGVRGVMHSFTGDERLLADCLELGLYISFAGMVTFKKSDALREVARRVPDDRLLIETDSPYLSPEPVRHIRPNEPANLVHTAQCLAATRGCSIERLAEFTSANALRLFRRGPLE